MSMNDGHPAMGIGIFIAFIIISAILHAFGAAIQAVNENTIQEKSDEGNKKSKKILQLIDNPVNLINSIHMTTIISNVVVGAWIIGVVSRGIEEAANIGRNIWLPWLIGIILVIIFAIFGIFVPKKVAVRNSEKTVYSLIGIVTLLLNAMRPVTFIITKISNCVIMLCGIDPYADGDNVTEEEIITMVNEGHEQGVLLASEAEMITNIVEFGDKEARDIMTHRKNIIAIDANNTINQVFEIITNESNSRYPVFDDNIDNIIGILHFRDLIKIYADSYKRNYTLKELKDQMLFQAHFIPETRNINALFKSMQSEKIHMAIVVDEYGQTSGIVTMEDILEEIVGNIMDEYDEDEQFVIANEDGSYIMDGATLLDDIEDLLDITFEDEDFDTLNGFMTSMLGKIPETNEQFECEHEGYRFKILSVENKLINKVRVIKM